MLVVRCAGEGAWLVSEISVVLVSSEKTRPNTGTHGANGCEIGPRCAKVGENWHGAPRRILL